MTGNVQAVELVVLLLLLFVVAFGALARKLQVPYPIVLVIAGGLLGFVPGIPKIALNPDVIFFVILPPLLYSAAWVTSWREFSYNMFSILLLAFGLVIFTVTGVAESAHALALPRVRLEARTGARRRHRAHGCARRYVHCGTRRHPQADHRPDRG